MFTLILLVVLIHSAACIGTDDDKDDLFTVNITMSNYQSSKEDEIIFLQYRLPDEEWAIVGYIPLVTMESVHHMDTFACEMPASQDRFWTGASSAPCAVGEYMLLYGWDHDALPIRFPQDIGIAIGKNTPYKYIVVNIHYLPKVNKDFSGNGIIFTRKRLPNLAGVALGGSNAIHLPPKTRNVKSPFSCVYHGPTLSIFAAGVHAHRWARVNSLYRLRNGNVTLIIKGDPQQSRHSYALASRIEISDGDHLIGQCVYDNTEDRLITVGPTHHDEMCNVMFGYSYQRMENSLDGGRVPLQSCYENRFPDLIAHLPADSDFPPSTSSIASIVQETHIPSARVGKKIVYVLLIFVPCLIVMVARRTTGRKRRDGFKPLQISSDGEGGDIDDGQV